MFFRLAIGEKCILVIVGAYQSFLVKRLVTLHVGALITQVAFSTRKIGLGGVELADQVGLVQFGDHLPFLYDRVVIHVKLVDDTAHLGTDGHACYRLDGTCGSDTVLKGVGPNFLLLEVDILLLLAAR